jgi:hypothetical protein
VIGICGSLASVGLLRCAIHPQVSLLNAYTASSSPIGPLPTDWLSALSSCLNNSGINWSTVAQRWGLCGLEAAFQWLWCAQPSSPSTAAAGGVHRLLQPKPLPLLGWELDESALRREVEEGGARKRRKLDAATTVSTGGHCDGGDEVRVESVSGFYRQCI